MRIVLAVMLLVIAISDMSTGELLKTDTIKILPLGNSITNGDPEFESYRKPLWNKLTGSGYLVDFIGSLEGYFDGSTRETDHDSDNEAHWGATTGELLEGLTTWLTMYTPNIVLIHAGTNDMYTNPDTSKKNLQLIIDKLRNDNPLVHILLAKIIPLSGDEGEIDKLNTRITELASEMNTAQSPVILVDQNSGFNPEEDTYDGCHANIKGSEKMAQKWYDALLTILPSPTSVAYNAQPIRKKQPSGTFAVLTQCGTKISIKNTHLMTTILGQRVRQIHSKNLRLYLMRTDTCR